MPMIRSTSGASSNAGCARRRNSHDCNVGVPLMRVVAAHRGWMRFSQGWALSGAARSAG